MHFASELYVTVGQKDVDNATKVKRLLNLDLFLLKLIIFYSQITYNFQLLEGKDSVKFGTCKTYRVHYKIDILVFVYFCVLWKLLVPYNRQSNKVIKLSLINYGIEADQQQQVLWWNPESVFSLFDGKLQL